MFFGTSNKLRQLKIYYLFLHADGSISADEMHYLNEIISQMNLSAPCRQEYMAFCDCLQKQYAQIDTKTAIKEIEKLVNQNSSLIPFCDFRSDKKIHAQTIWTLINLGYVDTVLSNAEIDIITYLVKHWKVDATLVHELYDIAETILTLENQKEWLQTTSKTCEEIRSAIEEIDRNIDSLTAAVKMSILEADIM